MQRITALGLTLTALAVGFSGFLIWSRMKIQKNYRDSLRNQSKYLAYESEKLLSEEKRIEAIQLALAALPTDDNDRPVTSEAIRALTDSTLAYQPLSGNTIQSVWNYQTSTRIERMALSPERTSFTVSESTQTVTTWDTKTHEVIFEKAFSGKTVFALNYIGDEDLLVTTDKTVYMIDLNKSKVTWEYSLPDLSNFNTYGPLFPEDMSSIYLPSSGRIILHFSMDGQLMEQYELPLMIDDKVATFSNYALSPDGNKIAFHLNSDSNYIGVFTFADKSIQRTEIAGPDVRELIWADNETVVFVEFDYLSSENLLRDTNIVVQPHTDIVSCVDTSTMTRKWSKEFKYNVNYSFSELLNLPARNAVAYETGDGIVVYSVETGEELGLYMIQQVVVDIDDSDGDGSFIFVTQSGGLGSPLDSISTNTTTISYEFVDKIRQVLIGDGVYVLQDGGSEVLYYDLYVSDSEWTEIDEDVVLSSLYEFYTDDDYLVISSIDSEKKTSRILAYDANDTELLFDIMLPSDGYSGSRILGIYKDKLYVLDHDPDFQVILYEISMKNGELENETILGSSYISLSDYCSMTDNYLTHYVRSDYSSDFQICLLDLKTGKEELFDMPESDLFPRSAPKYYPEYKVIHFSTETEDYMLDVTDESYIDFDVPGDWSMTFVVEHDSKGERWILSDSSRVIVFNSEGRQEMQLECNGLSAIGATFLREGKSDEQILVVFDDGSLYRYDAKDGSFLGKSEVETYYNSMVRAKFRVFEDQNLIYIQTGEITDIVDIQNEDYKDITSVPEQISVEIKDMTFAYDKKKNILEHLSLTVKPGDIVGIVGHSGAGKTTLIRLLLSLLKPDEGSVEYIDENGNRENAQPASRRFISYVPQGNTLLSGSIAQNLRMGKKNASEEELWEALRMADADTFVMKTEDGLDTKLTEKAGGLSEGQAQRIAIARALIRNKPQLILDEATSALDEDTESRILSRITKSYGKTIFIITHRRSMLRYCNRVIELGDDATATIRDLK